MTKTRMHDWRREENMSLDVSFCPVAECWKVYYLPTLQFGKGETPHEAKLALFETIQREGIKRHWWKFGLEPYFLGEDEEFS